jgi:hypothetical protein
VQDDTLFGMSLPPDGRRAQLLNIGAVIAYDLPAYGMLAKVKALTSAHTANISSSPGIALTLIKKLY